MPEFLRRVTWKENKDMGACGNGTVRTDNKQTVMGGQQETRLLLFRPSFSMECVEFGLGKAD